MIHVQTWSGSGSARIVDMTHAHKRGKRCRLIRFSGWLPHSEQEPYLTISRFTRETVAWANQLPRDSDFDTVAARLRERVAAVKMPMNSCHTYDEEIRAVDAPRPVLTAGVPGKWSASADESGLSVSDEVDQNNLPALITVRQSPNRAYEIAAKVWDQVKQAATFGQAGDILRNAGCELHYYCRMD